MTIFVVNNCGGGIFQHLPIAKEAEFEKCFATPQKFNLGKLCESFHISHELLDDWDSITERIIKPIQSGIRVIEIQTNRKKDKVFGKIFSVLDPLPMPELAEVAYACSQWDRGIGKYIKSIHAHPSSRVFRDLNRENLIKSLTGRKLTSSFTHGKQMLFRFSSDLWLGLHLGMTGSLHFEKSFYQKHKHDALVLFQSKWTLIFRDPRQFGRIRFHQGMNSPNWWSDLPLSILDPKYNKNILVDALARHSKRPIKALLLDQRYFQGIGNWMADEILWRAHIHPALPCGKINEKPAMFCFRKFVLSRMEP